MGKNKTTITEIARAAGISPATVSRALNHPELVNAKTAELIRSTIEEMNYVPRSGVSDSRQNKLIMINVAEISNLFYEQIISGIVSSAQFHNYHVIISQDQLDSPGEMDYLISQIATYGIDGLILCAPLKEEQYRQISQHVPLVQCCEYNSEQYPYVGIDDQKSTFMAMEYLHSLGRTKTAFINGPLTYTYAVKRQNAFLEFLSRAGLPSFPGQITNLPRINYDMAYASIRQMLVSSSRPDSIFAASDVFAVAAVKAADYYGIRVPEELAVVGFDNVLLSTISSPSITTVSQPRFQMGYTAGELLYESITATGPCPPKHIVLDTELIIRDSSSVNATAIRSQPAAIII